MFEKADVGTLIALGVDALVAYALYRVYQSSCRDSVAVQNAKKYEIGPELREKLQQASSKSLSYVCVEGIATAAGKALKSSYDDREGVIQTKSLIEHKSKRSNGYWSDVKNVIRDAVETVAFYLQSSGSDEVVHISEPTNASFLMDDLTVTYDQFEPNNTGLLKRGVDRIFGEVSKGFHETEKMLLVGTELLGIGELILDGKKMRLRPSKHGRYIITKLSKDEVIRKLDSKSTLSKVFLTIFVITGGGLVTFLAWRLFKRWRSRREHERMMEEVLRARETRMTRAENRLVTVDAEEEDDGSFDPTLCVICLSNPREVVLLNCGHVCLCMDCVGQLPEPRLCPICRENVVRYVHTYTP